jgi:hypothetical protein
MADLTFPSDLENADRPIIRFSVNDGNDTYNVNFACPNGVSFNDGAQFNEMSLTLMGGAMGDTTQTMKENFFGNTQSISAEDILRVATDAIVPGNYSQFATKNITNPNTNLAFTGNNVRSFAFNFKMIATSDDESKTIRFINSIFRKYTYGKRSRDESSLRLEFPPYWNIKFYDSVGDSYNENRFIPKIYACYLTQVETTFNSDANVFFNDGAPLSLDMSLQFQEVRALARNDIEALEPVSTKIVQTIGVDDDAIVPQDSNRVVRQTPRR